MSVMERGVETIRSTEAFDKGCASRMVANIYREFNKLPDPYTCKGCIVATRLIDKISRNAMLRELGMMKCYATPCLHSKGFRVLDFNMIENLLVYACFVSMSGKDKIIRRHFQPSSPSQTKSRYPP